MATEQPKFGASAADELQRNDMVSRKDWQQY